MEVMVVMIIMIILLGLSYSAYVSFTETTKFNEDVSTLQHDVLVIQRASMLMERSANEDWIYGLVIDFAGIRNLDGTYNFYKWCSSSKGLTTAEKNNEYPSEEASIPPFSSGKNFCSDSTEELVGLVGYGYGLLNLREDVHIDSNVRFIMFESVSGRAFLYDAQGDIIKDSSTDLEIVFDKNYGPSKILTVKNLTGRTKLSDVVESE